MPRINGKTRTVGIMGAPVSHSLSPLIHNYWLEKYAVNGVYVPLPVTEGQFETAVKGLMAAGFKGVNVTIPFKEQAFKMADEADQMTAFMGSANILVFDDEKNIIKASSSDGVGFWNNLEDCHHLLQGRKALVLGAGGAGRAIAGVLIQKKMHVTIANRSAARAEKLAQQLTSAGNVTTLDWGKWEAELGRFDLLVNTTSLGMNPAHADQNPEFEPDLSAASSDLVVADIVYTPLITPLLQAAQKCHLKYADGLGMLIQQARSGFQAWFDIMPEVDQTLRNLLVQALNNK